MDLFFDATTTVTEEQQYLIQVYKALSTSDSDSCFLSNSTQNNFNFPLTAKWLQLPQPSIINKLKADKGYKSFIEKTILRKASAKWITDQPNHIFAGKTTQIFIASNLDFLQHPQWHNKQLFNRKKLAEALQVASQIIVPWQYYKSILQKDFSIPENKIEVLYPKPSELAKPLEWTGKEAIKNTYTNGKDFFVYTASDHPRYELLNVLKAFSIFKKWQQSSMQLVIISEKKSGIGVFDKIETYKYKNDVHIIMPGEENSMPLIASAYACIHPVVAENIPFAVLNALYCKTPVITTNLPVIKEFADNAVMYADPEKVDEIAQNMILLYKDERLRNQYIEKAGNLKFEI